MAHVGRAIRAEMRAAAWEEAHPEEGARRIRRREIADQATGEREARWPVLSAENAAEAIRWQNERQAELEKAEGLR